MATERPTEDEIREALEWLEDTVRLVEDLPDIQSPRTALTLARRGAQVGGALDLLDGAEGANEALRRYRAGMGAEEARVLDRAITSLTAAAQARRALLARIAPETETTDGD